MAITEVGAGLNQGMVLVVDDRNDILDSSGSFLEAIGVPFKLAESINVALDILSQHGDAISYAFVDKYMDQDPGAGITLIKKIKNTWSNIKCLLITAWTLSEQEYEKVDTLGIDVVNKGDFALADYLDMDAAGVMVDGDTLDDMAEDSDAEISTLEEAKDQLFKERHEHYVYRLKYDRLKGHWAHFTASLINQLRLDAKRSKDDAAEFMDEGIFLNGVMYTAEQLIDEISKASDVGLELVKVHSEIVTDLLGSDVEV